MEAAVSLWAAAQDDSVAILAFGLDSIVELLAGGVLVWRLSLEREEVEEKAVEMRARRLLGLSFCLLATYVVLHSGANLMGWLPEPQSSPAGIGHCGSKRRCHGRPLCGQDARRHQDAVPVVEGRSHGKPLLRSSGPDHLGGTGPQQSVFLVVG